jgi:hypothetical protein
MTGEKISDLDSRVCQQKLPKLETARKKGRKKGINIISKNFVTITKVVIKA